jgi:hypothetical protein
MRGYVAGVKKEDFHRREFCFLLQRIICFFLEEFASSWDNLLFVSRICFFFQEFAFCFKNLLFLALIFLPFAFSCAVLLFLASGWQPRNRELYLMKKF